MAIKTYIGDAGGIARQVKKLYAGDANGIARELKALYVGDASGIARKIFQKAPLYRLGKDWWEADTSAITTNSSGIIDSSPTIALPLHMVLGNLSLWAVSCQENLHIPQTAQNGCSTCLHCQRQ